MRKENSRRMKEKRRYNFMGYPFFRARKQAPILEKELLYIIIGKARFMSRKKWDFPDF